MLKADASRRAKDIASACLWLAHAVPLADVLTMLEVRYRFELRPDEARVYAVTILAAANAETATIHQEEKHYAAA